MTGKILHGNCVDLMSDMPDGIIDLTVTSPPYDDLVKYNGYTFDHNKIIDQLHRITKPGGVCVWIVADQTRDGGRTLTSMRQALAFQTKGWTVHDIMVWQKPSAPYTHPNRHTNVWEYMMIFCRGQKPKTTNILRVPTQDGGGRTICFKGSRDDTTGLHRLRPGKMSRGTRQLHNVWLIAPGTDRPTGQSLVHPAQFPARLAKYHILTWSRPGDLVLDPMCGSGTTPAVAHSLGRRYLGIDISDEYVRIARRRVAKYKL